MSAVFLECYGQTGHFYDSAKQAGLCPLDVYSHMRADLTFAADVDLARQAYVQSLEDGAHRLVGAGGQ